MKLKNQNIKNLLQSLTEKVSFLIKHKKLCHNKDIHKCQNLNNNNKKGLNIMDNTKKTMKIPKPLLNDCLPIFKYLGLKYNISSNLWLQKLTYFIYKEAILKHNILLFSEEFESWKYGPVLRTAYNYFQDFENERTDYRLKNQKLTFSDYLKTRNENETKINNIFKEKTLKNLIESIVRKYENNSLTYLLTSAHDKYWKKAAMSPEGVIKKDWLFTDFSFINKNLQH